MSLYANMLIRAFAPVLYICLLLFDSHVYCYLIRPNVKMGLKSDQLRFCVHNPSPRIKYLLLCFSIIYHYHFIY